MHREGFISYLRGFCLWETSEQMRKGMDHSGCYIVGPEMLDFQEPLSPVGCQGRCPALDLGTETPRVDCPQGHVTQSSERSPVEAPSSRDTEPDVGAPGDHLTGSAALPWSSHPVTSSIFFDQQVISMSPASWASLLGAPCSGPPRCSHMSGPGATDTPSSEKAFRVFRPHLPKPCVMAAVLRPAGFGETAPTNADIRLETDD